MFGRVLMRFIRKESVVKTLKLASLYPKVHCACALSFSSANGLIPPTTFIRDISNQRSIIKKETNHSSDELKEKLIKKLHFKSKKDALPFYNLPYKTLLHIQKVTEKDVHNGYCQNRLYYIADKIQCPASQISEIISKRTFIYSLSFDWLENSLNVLLEMGVSSDRILRDLWVLKYHHVTIRERLQNVKELGVDTLYPWMVRCSSDILDRFVTITQDTKKILGDTLSTESYLANRLNITPEAVEHMQLKIPALKRIRVIKVKKFLDFLVAEGFDEQDIANKPRVLTASQKTVEQRLNKLRKLGLSEINLNVLCRGRKGFKKYCDSMESVAGGSSIHERQK